MISSDVKNIHYTNENHSQYDDDGDGDGDETNCFLMNFLFFSSIFYRIDINHNHEINFCILLFNIVTYYRMNILQQYWLLRVTLTMGTNNSCSSIVTMDDDDGDDYYCYRSRIIEILFFTLSSSIDTM